MRRHFSALLLALLLVGCRSTEEVDPDRAQVRLGMVADIQYADKDAAGQRHYRESLGLWKDVVVAWNEDDLDLAIQLGDLIDGRSTVPETESDLNYVLGATAGLNVPLRHVVGNHCLSLPREKLLARLQLTRSYYSYSVPGWRFIVLDTQAVSTCGWPEDSPQHERAQAYLEAHAGEPNAKDWNGAVGQNQAAWLTEELAAATYAEERVIVLGHAPLLEAASDASHLAWDHEAVVSLLTCHDTVVAYFAGHDHAGGYAYENGIHHVTVPGLLEADLEQGAHCVVELHEDRIEILGVGGVPSRTLSLEP